MTGLFSGIVGSLIGAGIQATFGGIPIREDASQALEVLRRGGLPLPPANWFSQKSPPRQRRENGYSTIEQRVAGAIQVLGPCIKIAQAFTSGTAHSELQSAGAKAWTPQEELARSKASYKSAEINDPTSLLAGTLGRVKKECCCECSRSRKETSSTRYGTSPIEKNCKPKENLHPPKSFQRVDNQKPNKTTEKLGNSPSNNFRSNGQESKNVRPTGSIKIEPNSRIKIEPNSSIKIEPNSFTKDKKLVTTENGKKGKSDPRDRDNFMITAENGKDLIHNPSGRSSTVTSKYQGPIKPQNKTDNSAAHNVDKCQSCQAQIKNRKKAPLKPCGHIICYKCLQTIGKKSLKCPKCGLKFN